MYPCVSPKRCMCNVSTGHAQGPSQWAPVFSQAITFPQSSQYANIRAVHMQHLVSIQLPVFTQQYCLVHSSDIPTWISHSYGTDEQ